VRYDGVEAQNATVVSKGDSSNVGWVLFNTSAGRFRGRVQCATQDAYSDISSAIIADGKWHHVVMYFNDAGAPRDIYLAIDGVWVSSYIVQTSGIGAIVPDAAVDLTIGEWGGGAISKNDRYSHGTDFIPPRLFPADDANYLASWPMNEGTGTAIDNIGNQGGAGSGAANRDGVLANGVWERQWEQVGSPVIPYSLEFDGAATVVDCGNHADVNDLADGILYAEAWVRIGTADDNRRVMVKGNDTTTGWMFNIHSGTIHGTVFCADTHATAQALHAVVGIQRDDTLYHIVMAFSDAGDRKIYFSVNGIWASTYDEQIAGIGAIVSDAALKLYLGYTTADTFGGAMSWARLSKNARYTVGTDFIPPSRLNPPANDVNAVAQWNFRDGSGATLTEENGNSDGTITFGDGKWNITPDMEIDAPGSRVFQWGYTIGVDAVDEGIQESWTGIAAGANRVHRPVVRYEAVFPSLIYPG